MDRQTPRLVRVTWLAATALVMTIPILEALQNTCPARLSISLRESKLNLPGELNFPHTQDSKLRTCPVTSKDTPQPGSNSKDHCLAGDIKPIVVNREQCLKL